MVNAASLKGEDVVDKIRDRLSGPILSLQKEVMAGFSVRVVEDGEQLEAILIYTGKIFGSVKIVPDNTGTSIFMIRPPNWPWYAQVLYWILESHLWDMSVVLTSDDSWR